MSYLLVQKLDPNAKCPTVAHPGEDLAYDIYALEDTTIYSGQVVKVRTGIAARYYGDDPSVAYGLKIYDRSSAADRGCLTLAGVIDTGYTGEILVMMTYLAAPKFELHRTSILPAMFNPGGLDVELRCIPAKFKITAGQKIAQMEPRRVLTSDPIIVTNTLPPWGDRGDGGFGSTGQ